MKKGHNGYKNLHRSNRTLIKISSSITYDRGEGDSCIRPYEEPDEIKSLQFAGLNGEVLPVVEVKVDKTVGSPQHHSTDHLQLFWLFFISNPSLVFNF